MKKVFASSVLFLTLLSGMFAQDFNYRWAKGIGNTYEENWTKTDRDHIGNTYLTGLFRGTVDFDPGNGVQYLTSQDETNGSSFILKMDNQGNFLWAKQLDIQFSQSTFGQVLLNIKVLDDGFLIASAFSGTADFDPGPQVFNMTSKGWWDAFLVKYDLEGNFLWAQSYGGGIINCARDIEIDSDKNILLTGYFSGTVDFNFSSGVSNLTSVGGADAFLLKLSSSGDFKWVKQFGGSLDDDGHFISVDEENNIYIEGIFKSQNFLADYLSLSSVGGNDIFICKLSEIGNLYWGKRIGNEFNDHATLAYNNSNNQVLIYGSFISELDVDPNEPIKVIESHGGYDVYLMALDELGNYSWSNFIGGAEDDFSGWGGITVDDYGNIFTCGIFRQKMDSDPSEQIHNLTSNGDDDIFVSMFSSSGNFVNSMSFGSNGNEFVTSIKVFSNSLLLSGLFNNTIDFDPGIYTSNITSNGLSDIFIYKLDILSLGVDNQPKTDLITIYPNPTSDNIIVDLKILPVNEGYTLQIINALSQCVLYETILLQRSIINLKSLDSSGIYMIQLKDLSGKNVESHKVVLQK